jgi:hypothetical protein
LVDFHVVFRQRSFVACTGIPVDTHRLYRQLFAPADFIDTVYHDSVGQSNASHSTRLPKSIAANDETLARKEFSIFCFDPARQSAIMEWLQWGP